MNFYYHRSITAQALGDLFDPSALEGIITANLAQDSLRGQVGHDEYHFDSNAFQKSHAYMESNRLIVQAALQAGDGLSARSAFGRLTHTAQDFYAHSNYIALWLARFTGQAVPAPADVDALDPITLDHPELHSGKLYYPLEILSFIPWLKKFIQPLFPPDSHARMNLDSPDRGPLFPYAEAAAVKRTRIEYEKTIRGLSTEMIIYFRNSS